MRRGTVLRPSSVAAWLLACGFAGAGQAAEWRFCAVGTLDILQATLYTAVAEPIEVGGVEDWRARLLSERSFEGPLATAGARSDALLDAAALSCGPARVDRAGALADRRTFDAELDAQRHGGLKTPVAPWPSPLPANAARTPHVAPVLDWRGRHASAATRASSPALWGLAAADFSSLHSRALLRKAGLPGRRDALARAADEGDAYAQFLLALRPPGEADDLALMRQAADQGLVRAIAGLHDGLVDGDSAHRAEHVAELRRLADLGNAHALYTWAMVVSGSRDGGDVEAVDRALLASARGGYAPAQFVLGEQLSTAPGRQHWRDGRAWLERAAAQGYEDAARLLADYPPEPSD